MKIKICGLKRLEDIEAVNDAMPDFAGFIFTDKSRRYVTPEQAVRLKRELNAGILSVGVFVNEHISLILDIVQHETINLIQLHGSEDKEYLNELQLSCGLPVIKAVSMTAQNWKEELKYWEDSSADYLLLDSGTGGSGRQFDYGRIENITKPFFLAGGLNPGNIAEAARMTQPFGLDMSSGVETDGKKDRKKINEAVRRIRNV
jgi:phosphoribosylanthranilate isomerase